MWHNYAVLIDTLGIDPLPNVDKDMSPEVLEQLLNERYSSLNTDVIPGLLDEIENMKKAIAAKDISQESPEDITEKSATKNDPKDRSNLVIYDPVFKANYEYLID